MAACKREQPVLAVDRAENALSLGHFENAERRIARRRGSNLSGSSHEMMTAPAIDGRSRA